jgi:TonB family protein
MTTAVAVIVDVSVVMALALLVCRVLRRQSASLRHLILAASLVAAAVAPALEAMLPEWELPLLARQSVMSPSLALESEVAPTPAPEAVATAPAPRLTWIVLFAAVWGIGAVVVLAGLLAGVIRLRSMTGRCQPVHSRVWRDRTAVLASQNGLVRPVAILESPDRALLLTWGVFQPRIIVPADAASWTGDRIDVILAHELAHIARRDWALQILAEIVRAVYWFNPLVWITCRQLRDESEQACDDAVLRRGLNPVDYASHLLAVARHLLADGRTWASAPAVADPSTLERRIAAMLKDSRNRQPLTRTAAAFTLAGIFAVAVPLAAVTLTERHDASTVVASARPDIALALSEHQRVEGLIAPEPAIVPPATPTTTPRRVLQRTAVAAVAAAQAPASVSGVLSDPSGAVLPGVQLTLTNAVSNVSSSAVSDGAGRFVFRNVAPAAYRLEAKLPGFATIVSELTISSGEDIQRNLRLRVGSLTESVVVNCAPAVASVTIPTVPASRRAQAGPSFDLRYASSRLWTGIRASLGITPTFAAQAPPVRVGGQIAAPRRTKAVQPACPGIPIGAGGVVLIEATLGPDGLIKDAKILRSIDGRPEFGQSAIAAVRQWEYTPTRLNNVPIAVIVTVSVVYAPI